MNDSLPSDSSGAECWVCRDTSSTPENPIINRVCRCIGSIGSVHQNCIDRWVFQNERMECPSCGAAYNIVYTCPHLLAYPESIFSKVKLVVTGFFAPILAKLIILILGLLLSFVVAPLVIGFIHHGEKSWLRRPSTVSWVKLLEVYAYGVTNISLVRLILFGFKYWVGHPRHNQRQSQQEVPLMNRDVHASGPAVEANDNNPHPHDNNLEALDENLEGYNSEIEDIEDEAFCDLSKTGFVASAHDWIDSLTKQSGINSNFFCSLARDLGITCPLALVLRAPRGLDATFTIFVAIWVLWQIWIPKRKIQNPQRRYEEVMERLGDLTLMEVTFLYITYILETILFSFILPIIAGIVVHYGTAPFLVKTPDSISSFMAELNIFKVIGYWVIGTLCSLVLMATMYKIISPLFAPGVELFYVRSIDFRSLDTHILRLNLMFTRVFDIGPPQLVLDFLSILVFEMGALFFFIAMPCWVTFGIREALFSDLSSGRLSIPLSFGIPSRNGMSFRRKFPDVQQLLKTSQVFDSYNFPAHSELENGSKLHAEAVDLTHLAKVIPLGPEAVSNPKLSLSLDDTGPLYKAATFALAVAVLHNDTAIISKLLPLARQDRNAIETTLLLLRVFASSGYICPACFLSVGHQLSLFETPDLAPLLSLSNGKPVEGVRTEDRNGTPMVLPQQKDNATDDFPLSGNLMAALSPIILQWQVQRPTSTPRACADDQNKSAINCLFDAYSIVHQCQRPTPALTSQKEAAEWSPVQVLNWDDSSIVCLVLLMINCLCRIPGFDPVSRFILSLFLYQGGFVLFLQSAGLISLALTFSMCLIQFPIQRMQLRYLQPFVLFFGRKMGLEAFLFDAERLKLVDQFLRDSSLDHLDVPMTPPEAILLRREYALPREKIPSHYKLRLFVFAMSFLLVGTLLFWLPFIFIFSLMLCAPLPTLTMLLGAGCIFFFLSDPSEFFECVLLAHCLILVLLGFTLFSSYWALSKLSLKKLTQETFFFMCKVKRHVGAYDLEEEGPGGEDRKHQKMIIIVHEASHTERRLIPIPDGDNEN